MTLPLVWKVYFIKSLQPQFYCWHSQISLLGCKFHFSSIIRECSTGGLSLGASFACFSVSGNSGLILCFWEWWTGRDHFLVLVSVWGTTSSCISLLVNPGNSSKISKLITHSLQRFQQLCYLPARMRWRRVDAGPGWIHPFWWGESHSSWSQSEHRSTSWTPLRPSLYNTTCPPCSYGLYMHLLLPTCKKFAGQLTGFGQNLVSATPAGFKQGVATGMNASIL